MSQSEVRVGGRLRDRVGARKGALGFGLVGVVLVGAGLAVPSFATLLLVWGGTALFVALLLGVVMTEPTVTGGATTDIYTAMAGNARRLAPPGPTRYVPDGDGVSLAVGDWEGDPVGARLLAGDPVEADTVADTLASVADVVVNGVELAASVRASTGDTDATVTVVGSRVGTGALFDHPVASMVGVALATHLDRPVRVESAVEDGRLVVTCEWTA